MKNKLIFLKGKSNVGKSTCIIELATKLKLKGYNLHKILALDQTKDGEFKDLKDFDRNAYFKELDISDYLDANGSALDKNKLLNPIKAINGDEIVNYVFVFELEGHYIILLSGGDSTVIVCINLFIIIFLILHINLDLNSTSMVFAMSSGASKDEVKEQLKGVSGRIKKIFLSKNSNDCFKELTLEERRSPEDEKKKEDDIIKFLEN